MRYFGFKSSRKRETTSNVDFTPKPDLESLLKSFLATGEGNLASPDDTAFDFLDGNVDFNRPLPSSDVDVFVAASASSAEEVSPLIQPAAPAPLTDDVNPPASQPEQITKSDE